MEPQVGDEVLVMKVPGVKHFGSYYVNVGTIVAIEKAWYEVEVYHWMLTRKTIFRVTRKDCRLRGEPSGIQ